MDKITELLDENKRLKKLVNLFKIMNSVLTITLLVILFVLLFLK